MTPCPCQLAIEKLLTRQRITGILIAEFAGADDDDGESERQTSRRAAVVFGAMQRFTRQCQVAEGSEWVETGRLAEPGAWRMAHGAFGEAVSGSRGRERRSGSTVADHQLMNCIEHAWTDSGGCHVAAGLSSPRSAPPGASSSF
jgi:hypothetical protein